MRNPLRPLVLTMVFGLLAVNSIAQWVSIPDTNFAASIYAYHPGCMQGNNTSGWLLDTTCPSVISRKFMDGTFQNLKDITGIQYFDSLEELNCSANQLTFIAALPGNLKQLTCHSNQLTSLPALPAGLETLYCNNNQLPSLPALPSGLTHLNCRTNKIVSIPALPAGLLTLDCFDNNLTSLPVLPGGLKELLSGYNSISSLPALPDSLILLWCHASQITSLPALPQQLVELRCNNNQLTALPALPQSLKLIYCGNNPSLTSIPELPDSLYTFSCNSNIALTCLPELKKVNLLDFNNTAITCLPNYPTFNFNSLPALNTVPLCSSDTAVNPNNCLVLTTSVSEIPTTSFTLFPNPASNSVTISISESLVGSTATVSDVMGRVVFKSEIQNSKSEINLAGLGSGVYFVTVGNRTLKLMVAQ